MSDWDFLYEMHERGYSPEEIADAAGSGAAPWEWEYISREWVDSRIDGETPGGHQQSRPFHPAHDPDGFPFGTENQVQIFCDLVGCAQRYFGNTGRYIQLWGELGELYAEIKFGLLRHAAHAAGSDGAIAGKLVEVKTISPEKASDRVNVKSQGDFEQLLIVRIDSEFRFSAKLLERSALQGSTGKFLRGRFQGNERDAP